MKYHCLFCQQPLLESQIGLFYSHECTNCKFFFGLGGVKAIYSEFSLNNYLIALDFHSSGTNRMYIYDITRTNCLYNGPSFLTDVSSKQIITNQINTFFAFQ